MKDAINDALLKSIETRTNLKKQYLVTRTIADIDGDPLTRCRDVMPMPLHTDNVVTALTVLHNVDFIVYGGIITEGKKLRLQGRSNNSEITAGHCWLQLKDGTHIDPSIQSQPVIIGHEINLKKRTYVEAFKITPEELKNISQSILPPKLVGVVGIPLEGFANISSHSVYFK